MTSGDLISRQAVLEQTYLWSKDEFLRVTNPFDYLRKKIMDLPPVKPQEPCEDAISRQAVLDVWHTSYSDNREENEEIQYKKIAFELPSVNPQEPKIGNLVENLCDLCTNKACEFQFGIQRSKCDFYIPPMPHLEPDNCGNYVVQQEPKTGHWIPTYGNVKCSVCGSVKDSREVGKATHYCDFCGAKMIEKKESEVQE